VRKEEEALAKPQGREVGKKRIPQTCLRQAGAGRAGRPDLCKEEFIVLTSF